MGATKAKTTEVDLAAEMPQVEKVQREAKVRGKKYVANRAKINRNNFYSIKEAIALVKDISYSKFDGTMELHLVVKKEGISTNVALPHSAGRSKKVVVADDAVIESLKSGKIDFDVLLATADMMPKLVMFAKLLGPRGMMPNPKNGTLIKSKEDAKNFSTDTLTVKTERKTPIIHTIVGKVSMSEKDLSDNIEAIFKAVGKTQLVKAYLKPTMGPSVKIALA